MLQLVVFTVLLSLTYTDTLRTPQKESLLNLVGDSLSMFGFGLENRVQNQTNILLNTNKQSDNVAPPSSVITLDKNPFIPKGEDGNAISRNSREGIQQIQAKPQAEKDLDNQNLQLDTGLKKDSREGVHRNQEKLHDEPSHDIAVPQPVQTKSKEINSNVPNKPLNQTISNVNDKNKNVDKSAASIGIPPNMKGDVMQSGALLRGFYVFLGLSVVIMMYFLYRSYRLRHGSQPSTTVRKYGVTARRSDMEMRPLELEDEDDDTLFEISSQNINR